MVVFVLSCGLMCKVYCKMYMKYKTICYVKCFKFSINAISVKCFFTAWTAACIYIIPSNGWISIFIIFYILSRTIAVCIYFVICCICGVSFCIVICRWSSWWTISIFYMFLFLTACGITIFIIIGCSSISRNWTSFWIWSTCNWGYLKGREKNIFNRLQ